MANANLSKEFFELLKAIGESKSKQEEDRIIDREILCLKKKLESPPPSSSKSSLPHGLPSLNTALSNKKKAKEFLVRLLYVEMLGHDGSFGYIKAIELAASSSIVHKRTGYLVCGACLPPEHEFRFMLVNQMQRDLSSSSVLEVSAALIAVTRLITGEMVAAMLPPLVKLFDHASETVRKKAIMALHRFYQITQSEGIVVKSDLVDKVRRSLCDRDPAVMGSSLNVIDALAEQDPTPFKDLIPSLISILKQVCEHRLPSDFDYHRVPAPWIQMKIVRILAILGKRDAAASEGMYEILNDCMKRADVGINAGYAVVYECVRTITAIYPNPTLLDAAAEAISRFISSRSHNLKYLGVTGLAAIVEVGPQYAAPHQLAVIECLEDRDETLQRKTLDLLYRMTNPVNVEFITDKMLQFLRGTTDPFLRSSLTSRVCTIAERFAPNNAWYIKTITDLFEISGDLVKPDVAQNLMSLIAEGTGDDDDADIDLRRNAVELYASLLDRPKLPQILAETMAWVLGEYAYLSTSYTLEQILVKLCSLAKKTGIVTAPSTRKFLITAIMKLVAQGGTCPPLAAHAIDDFTKSRDVDLQQRCLEFQNLLTSASHVMGDVLPVDASCEDIQADETLTFLDWYVQEARTNGAVEYSPPEGEDDEDEYAATVTTDIGFKITPYEKPHTNLNYVANIGANTGNAPPAPMEGGPPPMGGDASAMPPSNEPQLVLRSTANVWGKGGLSAQPPKPTSQPATGGFQPAAPTPSDPYGSSAPPPPTTSTYKSNPSSGYAGWGSTSAPQSEPAVAAKSQADMERERMAAALFGGMVPGAAPPVAAPAPRVSAPAPAPVVTPAPVPAATPAPPPPAPAPEVDLLDLSFGAPEPTSAAPPASQLDPFMLGGEQTTAQPTKFEFKGETIAPLSITTSQFGQSWGTCTFSHSLSITTSSSSIHEVMDGCLGIGLHKVEVIPATSEGIASGLLGKILILVHFKFNPQLKRVDAMLKWNVDGDAGKEFGKVLEQSL